MISMALGNRGIGGALSQVGCGDSVRSPANWAQSRASGLSSSKGLRQPSPVIDPDATTDDAASAQADELETLFTFLGRIQQDAALRDLLNEVITAPDVVAIAADQGFSFQASSLLSLFERCNEAPLARQGLMDEKLIRVYLQRQRLQAP